MKKEVDILEEDKEEEVKSEVDYLTLDMLPHHTIYDIAMPILGYDTIIKSQEIQEIYDQCMKDEGITREDLKLSSKLIFSKGYALLEIGGK